MPRVGGDPITFLRTFSGHIVERGDGTSWATHVAGHPPGALLFFWARTRYCQGVASDRPAWYFLWANVAALAIAVGPAVVLALVRLGRRRVRRRWTGGSRVALLAVSSALALLVADLSLLSKGEVERIRLPFMPWLTLATVLLVGPPGPVAGRRRARRGRPQWRNDGARAQVARRAGADGVGGPGRSWSAYGDGHRAGVASTSWTG